MEHRCVAVITRTKNRPSLLKRAANSITDQTFNDVAWIIVNDGGVSDPVNDIANQVARNGREVRVIHNSKSVGMEAASNIGIRHSSSEYIAIHDDDDSWQPDFLARTVACLQNTNRPTQVMGVITHCTKIVERLNETNVPTEVARQPFNNKINAITLWNMAARNMFPPISFLYKREVLAKIGLYDETLPVLGDWDFNLRFIRHYDIDVVPELLANWHHRLEGVTSEYANSMIGQGGHMHRYYDSVLRNRMLRVDLDAGQLGLGFLMNCSEHLQRISLSTDILTRLTAAVKRKVFFWK